MKLLDTIEKLNKTEYDQNYGEEITWSCTLSNGTLYKLRPNGNQLPVTYEERLEYCQQVKHIRLNESDRKVCLFDKKKTRIFNFTFCKFHKNCIIFIIFDF